MSKTIKEVILHKAIKNIGFAQDVLTNLPSALFNESDGMSALYTVLKRNAFTGNEIKSQEALNIKVEDTLEKAKVDTDSITEALSFVNDMYTAEVDKDDATLNEEVQKYVKTEMSKDVLVKFLSEGKQEDASHLTELVEKLKEIEVKDIEGTSGTFIDFFEDVEEKRKLLKTIKQNKYSTGFTSVDREIEGGIARGEVGLLIAGTGKGKSMVASNLAKNYVHQGLSVLYVALEENENRIILRAEQQMLGIDKGALLNENMELQEHVFDAIQTKYTKDRALLGNYYISKHMPGDVTPNMLEQLIINTKIKKGKPVDVVIIDYPELMKNPHLRGMDISTAGGKLFEDIRRMAQQYSFICWTLAQTNRNATSANTVTSEHVEGSRKILNAVEVCLVLNQRDTEFKSGFLRLYLDKVRNSSRSGDPFVYLKVDPQKLIVRDETQEERAQHDMVLKEDENNSSETVGKFKKQQSNSNKKDKINSGFGGF